MKTCGIIVEYNPFHNGHLHHIKQARLQTKCDFLIAVLSPNFVQRGEPSLLTKWDKTELALDFGVDLVLELPTIFATQSASQFAEAAIQILTLAGVDFIVFGSESNDLKKLQEFAAYPIRFYDKEESYVRQWSSQFENLQPNDILAVCYLRAIEKLKSHIIPIPISRTNCYHETELTSTISSATAIRSALQKKQSIDAVIPYSFHYDTTTLSSFYPYIQTLLLTQNRKELASFFLMDEGIEGLFKRNAKAENLDVFLDACTSKRYTKSRIRRTLLHLLLQTKKEEVPLLSNINYARVLGFNSKGQLFLKQKRKEEGFSFISLFSKVPEPQRNYEMRATSVYTLCKSQSTRQRLWKRELDGPVQKEPLIKINRNIIKS